MNRERIEELWARILAGQSLAREEELEWVRALEADPELRAELLGDYQLDGMLGVLRPGPGEEDAALREFTDAVEAERDAGRFIARVEAELAVPAPERRKPRRALRRVGGRRPSMALAWIAAAAAAAAVLLVVLFASRPPRAPAGPTAAAKSPEATPGPERPTPSPPAPAPPPPPRPRVPEVADRPAQGEPSPRPTPEPTPGPAPAPKPVPTAPPPAPGATTRAALASLRNPKGEVHLLSGNDRAPAGANASLLEGQGLETVGRGSSAELAFQDGTVLTLREETTLRSVSDAVPAKPASTRRLVLARGTLVADVARQAAGRSVVFDTPHAEARVLGTALTLTVDAAQTRLEVREGKVRLTRLKDRRSVDVAAGAYAVAAEGRELADRPLPIDEIVLFPREARVAGGEWAPVRDAQASSGFALEAARTSYRIKRGGQGLEYESLKNRPSFATFEFSADADRDYALWVWGRATAATERERQDEVALELPGAQLSRRCPYLGPVGDNAYVYNGFSVHAAYGWIGGTGEGGQDGVPLEVRFARSGKQALRLYAVECPMRIDAIWLSATQKTRPAASQGPPRGPGR